MVRPPLTADALSAPPVVRERFHIEDYVLAHCCHGNLMFVGLVPAASLQPGKIAAYLSEYLLCD